MPLPRHCSGVSTFTIPRSGFIIYFISGIAISFFILLTTRRSTRHLALAVSMYYNRKADIPEGNLMSACKIRKDEAKVGIPFVDSSSACGAPKGPSRHGKEAGVAGVERREKSSA